ncbi:MAG: N-acetyl-gamma-glutamyl-phosphate reductase [Actinomycetota bacterium]
MKSVAVVGASGYAGGEILRLLLNHPQYDVGAVTAARNAGSAIGKHHGHLTPLADRVLLPTHPDVLANHDAVVLALPHGQSASLVDQLPPNVVIIDCGADFRLTDPIVWNTYYDTPYAGSWPYGLPELMRADGTKQRDLLSRSKRIAIPGCYPTAITLGLAPGFASELLATDDVVVVAASGTSGAGRSSVSHLMASEVMGSMSPYGVGGTHRHSPEIEQNLALSAGQPVRLSFTPTLAPMSRGILATCTVKLNPGVLLNNQQIRQIWQDSYADEPFVELLPQGRWPRTADTVGANTVHLQLTVDRRVNRVVVVAAIDNLTKGTAGAAIQCLNLAFDLPEETGLNPVGMAP